MPIELSLNLISRDHLGTCYFVHSVLKPQQMRKIKSAVALFQPHTAELQKYHYLAFKRTEPTVDIKIFRAAKYSTKEKLGFVVMH